MNHDLLADSPILNMWMNYSLLYVHRVSDVTQIEIYTAELLALDPSPFEVETAIANLKSYKLPGNDQIPVKLFPAGGEILRSEIHTLIYSIWNNRDLPDQ
jgi:hypothetical protein